MRQPIWTRAVSEKKGGGRKKLIEVSAALEENFLKVLEDHTAGDPMRADVKWTNLSRGEIASRVTELGTPVSRHVVSQLLRKHKYRKRKALKKKTMGPRNPNRNAQFENIARFKKEYLKAGLPVISMDTKKKELLGNFYREGKIDTQETIETNDHDFGSAGVGTVIPHTLNLKEVGLARKTESPYSITCYNASRAGRRSFPMEIVGKVAATIQNVLGPEAEELGRATGVIQRRRKFTAVSLLRMLVLTLLRKPDAKATDFQSTAAQLGLDVTSTAVENRFTPQLVGFLRAVLERTVLRVLAASPQTVDLLNKFTSVRIGDSSTIALPDELADQFPGCGGILRAGLAAMKIHLLWDFLTGSILQLRITPGRASDATNPIAQEVAPAGSLSLFDLGYFCLDRFQNLTRAGAFWISRLQHGTSVFDAQGQPLALLQYLRQQTGSGPIDVSVLLGVSHRLPCRLIALRVPQEVADRRRQKAYVKAQKHGRVPSREYLEWQDWTIFVTNCEPELLTWEAVVVLYRARWQIELMFKLWKSHNRLATHRAGAAAEEQLAVVYVKLIAVLVQHWILLTATWCECRRSLMKAAAIIADWVTLLIDALDDLDRLIAILSRMKDVLLKAGARVQNRNIHPSLSQLLQNPILLDYVP